MTVRHLPVLVGEVIGLLSPAGSGVYVDATAGLGGHSEAILRRIGGEGRVIGIDRDTEALEMATARLNDSRFIPRQGSFSDMAAIAGREGFAGVDGIVLDLGVSMLQMKDLSKGFSFLSTDRLDMRMDRKQQVSAWDVVNGYDERDLARVIRDFGEDFRANRIARAIVRTREKKTIDTCAELAGVVASAAGRGGRIHPATRTFQALRIEVNRELDELRAALLSSLGLLKPGGRLCVISYHSLEDRIVKHFIRDEAKKGTVEALTRKPIIPGSEELRLNPSARSAKLRGAQKL
ncbi:MAG: 16S rRNA (cytosine(1402)-N(4))-methyltransferase RsmH [Thermodesulfovibrionales bacterium]